MLVPTYDPPKPPLAIDLETRVVLKALAKAHRHLAEMKGLASSIPNQGVLIAALALCAR